MVSLTTPKEFQAARRLSFCYLCGATFRDGDAKNGDHVPPKSCFAKSDRNVPLELPTHVSCNHAHHLVDEKLAQIIGLKREQVPAVRDRRLKFKVFPPTSTFGISAAITNVDIRGAIRRWIFGFHAGLYQEPLPKSAAFGVSTPLPSATISGDKLRHNPLLPQHALFVHIVKVNRFARNLDRIRSNNGRMLYECVWKQTDGSAWLCIFALNIYDWREMGSQYLPARGCVGFYTVPSREPPANATRATQILVAVPNHDPLDAFGR
jgi:hypothetical protein